VQRHHTKQRTGFDAGWFAVHGVGVVAHGGQRDFHCRYNLLYSHAVLVVGLINVVYRRKDVTFGSGALLPKIMVLFFPNLIVSNKLFVGFAQQQGLKINVFFRITSNA